MNTGASSSSNRPQARYTQVKVSVDPKIAADFKNACATSGVSMAAELSSFMADYANSPIKRKAVPDYSTRRRRRTAIKAIIKELESMQIFEESVRDNMPENLQSSAAYDTAEEAVSSIEEAIDALCAVWMVP